MKFANYLHDLHIPMTIFSAGLGDVIQQMLHSARVKMSAINVVANFLKFDYNVSSNRSLTFVFYSLPSISVISRNLFDFPRFLELFFE